MCLAAVSDVAGPQLPPAAGSFANKGGCCECGVTAALLPELPVRCKLLPPLLLMLVLVLPVPAGPSRSLQAQQTTQAAPKATQQTGMLCSTMQLVG
jgi:hypothetical protein